MTIRDALRLTAECFDQKAVSNPRLTAEILLAHCIQKDKTFLYTHGEHSLTPQQEQWLEKAVEDRAAGIPVQYIVGQQEFFGRPFQVNPSVLIPRPETELLVETALALNPPEGSRIVDVGTGSGCVGITLALQLPRAHVILTDISFDALRTAATNARRLGAMTHTACMDLLEAAAGPFDLVVCNPPYVGLAESSRLQREVREHEPHVALFAGEDGLSVYRRLIPSAHRILRPGGHLLMEIGFGLEESVLRLFDSAWRLFPTRADLQGIPRIVSAQLERP